MTQSEHRAKVRQKEIVVVRGKKYAPITDPGTKEDLKFAAEQLSLGQNDWEWLFIKDGLHKGKWQVGILLKEFNGIEKENKQKAYLKEKQEGFCYCPTRKCNYPKPQLLK